MENVYFWPEETGYTINENDKKLVHINFDRTYKFAE